MDFPALHTYIAIYIQSAHQSTYALDFICKAIISQQRWLVKHNLHANSSVCVSICQYANPTIATNRIASSLPQHIQQAINIKSGNPYTYTDSRSNISNPMPIHTALCLVATYTQYHTSIYIAQPYTPMVIYLYAYIHNISIYVHTYNHCIYLYTYIPILRGKIKKRNPRTRPGSGKNQAL